MVGAAIVRAMKRDLAQDTSVGKSCRGFLGSRMGRVVSCVGVCLPAAFCPTPHMR